MIFLSTLRSSIIRTALSKPHTITFSPQCLPSKAGQNEARRVDILVVVATQLLLLFHVPAPQRLLDIPIFILAANHKSNLSARVRRDSGVGVFDGREDLFAGFLQVGNEGEMEPLVLRWLEQSALS